jgi:transcriptional regulator with GAF, ATPase, and Fis domain
MKVSFVFAMLSAAAAVVALPATGTVKEVSNVVERAAAVNAAATTKPKKNKKIKVKPEVVPAAVKPVPTPASKSPKWSKNTHPKENVPKDFGKKKTGK